MEERTGAGGVRHFLASLVLAAVLACFAAYGAYLLGIQGPAYLLVGGLVGLVLFVFLQWWEYVGEPLVGSFSGPVKVKVDWPQYQRPEWAGKNKLRRDTLGLVKEMQVLVNSKPPAQSQTMVRWQAMVDAQARAQDQAEKDRIWNDYTREETQQLAQEDQEIRTLFGGRIAYFIAEYKHRRMLSDEEAGQLEWRSRSLGMLLGAAATFEALARRL